MTAKRLRDLFNLKKFKKQKKIEELRTTNHQQVTVVPEEIQQQPIVPATSFTPATVVRDVIELTTPLLPNGDRYIALNNHRKTINMGLEENHQWSRGIFFRTLELAGLVYPDTYITVCGDDREWKPTNVAMQYFTAHPKTGKLGLRVSKINDFWEHNGEAINHFKDIAIQETLNQQFEGIE